jgi:hypothetical protein
VRVLAGQLDARRYGKLRIDMGEAGPQRGDHRNVRLHRHVLRNDPFDQAGRSELRIIEWMGRIIARVRRRRRWWIGRLFVLDGLSQDRGDVSSRFPMPLEPGVYLLFAGPPLIRR